MKAKEFEGVLRAYSKLLRNVGAEDSAEAVDCIAPLFELQPNAKLADIAKSISTLDITVSGGSGVRIEHFLSLEGLSLIHI